MSANAFALPLRTPSGRIIDILKGKRGLSPETALRLGRYFSNSARFWLKLQTAHELAVGEAELGAQCRVVGKGEGFCRDEGPTRPRPSSEIPA